MAQQSASDGGGTKGPQRRAEPLRAKPLEEKSSAVQPIEEPSAPGPAPVPVDPNAQGTPPNQPAAYGPVPPAPIPVQGPWGQPAPPSPIPVHGQGYPPWPPAAIPVQAQPWQGWPPQAIPVDPYQQTGAPPSATPAWPQQGTPSPAPAGPVPVEPPTAPPSPPAEAEPVAPPSVASPPVERAVPAERPSEPAPAAKTESPAPPPAPEQAAGPKSAPQAPQPQPAPKQQAASAAAASAASTAKAKPVALTEAQKKQAAKPFVATKKWEQGHKATGVREELEEREEEGAAGLCWRDFLENNQSWLVSSAFHALLLIVLAVWMVHNSRPEIRVMASVEPPEKIEDELPEEFDLDKPLDPVEVPPSDVIDREVDMMPLEPEIDHMPAAEGINAASMETINFNPEDVIPVNDLLAKLGRGTGHLDQMGTGRGEKGLGFGAGGTGRGLGGRGGRRTKATELGATPESETAVDLALKWLADHQFPDGGWSFKHQLCPHCQGKCPNPGEIEESRTGATAMGVLPFLGAGQTHQVGDYQQTVAAGLKFLIARMVMRPGQGGDLRDTGGRMYSHGLAALALCEAYAMSMSPDQARKMENIYRGSDDKKEGGIEGVVSNDGHSSPSERKKEELQPKQPAANIGPRDIAALKAAAQAALNYIAYAQDPAQGGWRYQPRTPGDSSVVGWQLMAVTSGRMAGLAVHPATVLRASNFLDFVQRDDYGSDYGYTDKSRGTSATRSIGLLCRMYLGWAKDHPGIEQGVQAIGDMGPSHGNMYYNYYATQVMHHYGGELWKRWNNVMRDQLVNSQAKAGCPRGSWFFGGGGHGSRRGGRLYCTSMAAMTLEVYYRHLPLYRDDIFKIEQPEQPQQPQDDFPNLE